MGGAKKSDVEDNIGQYGPMLQKMGKKELAISDLSGIWIWNMHISCGLNHQVKSMLQVCCYKDG